MATEDFKRKLAAILHADVKGYSRLMGEDEEATVSTLTAYREVMNVLIQQHQGLVVHGSGDSLLAEFISVVDAVQCAVEIQNELKTRNAELPEDRKVEFRIGINLGDVIEKDEDLHGDGVNIAARIEGLAEGGGICISRTAFDQVRNKLKLGYEYIGEHSVKNIAQPVRVYRVLTEPEDVGKVIGEKMVPSKQRWKLALAAVVFVIIGAIGVTLWNTYFRPPSVEVASVEKMAFPLPEKPSIAVLPFVNMSDDPKQEYFSDGLTQDIITALSKIPDLFVIARNSMFTYKGKPVNVKQVAEEMGIRYVLEGSVRKTGERIRITAQLIDSMKGDHLWAERYDRTLEDIFGLQDEITMNIVMALQVKLTEGEKIRVFARSTGNLIAYQKYLKGRAHWLRINSDDNAVARQLFEEAISLDPEYSTAYVDLAWTYLMDIHFGVSKSPKESVGRAAQLARRAISLDETSSFAHSLLGSIFAIKRQFEEAIAQGEKAIALNPNDSLAKAILGRNLAYMGRYGEALSWLDKAIRLDPIPLAWYYTMVGHCYLYMGRHEEALEEFKKVLHRNQNDISAHIRLAAVYSLLGRKEDASAAAVEVLRLNPKFSIESIAKWPYNNKSDRDFMMVALRKAGLPESPPLPLPDKPSIAVLPFENMSDDPKQEYFSDGLTEEIITGLSKIQQLFVIARNSTFIYKGKPVKVQKVSRELGVRYILEGSVRKSGEQIRITAQLIDATTGNHLWAERYDRELKDIFAVQDEITKNIIMAMQVKLTEGEQARAAAKGTKNLDAYLKYLQANEYIHQGNPGSNALGKQLAEEAITLDPEYAWAYFVLGRAHMVDVWVGASKSPKDSISKAIELVQKAIVLDDTSAEAHGLLGFLYSMTREHDKAVAQAEKSVALNPNSAGAHFTVGKTLSFAGRWEESIPEYKKAIRLNPIPPNMYLWSLGLSYAYTEQNEEAIKWCEKAVRQEPDDLLARMMMTVVYSLLGQDEKARAEADEVLRIQPKFTLEKFEKTLTYKNKADHERFIGALRKAGLK